MNYKIGETVRLECRFSGMPVPAIHWYKDEIPFEKNDSRIIFHNGNEILYIQFVTIEDAGNYRCEATNRLGVASAQSTLKIKSKFGALDAST